VPQKTAASGWANFNLIEIQPDPETSNLKPETSNLKPQTSNLKPET